MVAKIVTGKSIRGILHYNEHKVEAGEAKLILASGFAGDIDRMSLLQKYNRFQHLTLLSPRVKTNALHISLNFHPDDRPGNERLQQISLEYMEAIGFSEQPFLVYVHEDSAHPHVHIVSTNIKRDGTRMDVHDIGKKMSEPARKMLEEKYGLIKAEGREKLIREKLKRIHYGDRPTKQSISNIVLRVSREFSYGSFAEFKATLEYFGVHADRGAEGTRMFEKKGLQYFCMDAAGKPKGVPIKASAIYSRPTMANLEKRFAKNLEQKKAFKAAVKSVLDQVWSAGKRMDEAGFTRRLEQQQLVPVFRRSAEGILYGISYIDLSRKVIFNGSELGKGYSAKAVSERLLARKSAEIKSSNPLDQKHQKSHSDFSMDVNEAGLGLILETLSTSKDQPEVGVPKRKKKRRKGKKIVNEMNYSL